MWYIWLVIAGVCFVIEMITVGFFVFWFGIGALLTMLVSLIFPNNWLLQSTVFIISSTLLIFLTKPLVDKFTKNDKNRGELPIGVHKYYNKYRVMCSNGYNQLVTLGTFDNISDAFNTYKEYKETLIKQIADDYINYIPSNLYEAMYNYTVDIND